MNACPVCSDRESLEMLEMEKGACSECDLCLIRARYLVFKALANADRRGGRS